MKQGGMGCQVDGPQTYGLRTVVPARRTPGQTVVLVVQVCGWLIFGVAMPLMGALVISAVLMQDQVRLIRLWPALLFLLAAAGYQTAWLLGRLSAFRGYLWGKEVIALQASCLCLKREGLGLGRWRRFGLPRVRNVRLVPRRLFPSMWLSTLHLLHELRHGQGPIAFDYGGQTYRFGWGLDETDAAELVSELRNAADSSRDREEGEARATVPEQIPETTQTVPVTPPRWQLCEDADGLQVLMPRWEVRFMVPFLIFVGVGWPLGVVFWAWVAVHGIKVCLGVGFSANTALLLLFSGLPFIVWTGVGCVVGWGMAWHYGSQEIIWVDDRYLTIRRHLWRLGRTRRFDLTHVGNFRPAPSGLRRSFFEEEGRIQFDYRGVTCSFGATLTESEATLLVDALQQRLPFCREWASERPTGVDGADARAGSPDQPVV